MHRLDTMFNRLAFSIVVAAMILAPALWLQVDVGGGWPLWHPANILLVVGFALGLWLLASIIRSGGSSSVDGSHPRLILALRLAAAAGSAEQAAYAFEVGPPGDGARGRGWPASARLTYALASAELKAAAVSREAPEALVLGADTVVAVGDEVLGKPADPADACRCSPAERPQPLGAHRDRRGLRRRVALLSEVVSTEVFFRSAVAGGDRSLRRHRRAARQGRGLRHPGAGRPAGGADQRLLLQRRSGCR